MSSVQLKGTYPYLIYGVPLTFDKIKKGHQKEAQISAFLHLFS